MINRVLQYFCLATILTSCQNFKKLGSENRSSEYQGYIIYYIDHSSYGSCELYVGYKVYCASWENVEKVLYNQEFYSDVFQYQDISYKLNDIGYSLITNDDYRLGKGVEIESTIQEKAPNYLNRDMLPLNQVGTITNSFFIVDKVEFTGIPASYLKDCGAFNNSRFYNLSTILFYNPDSVNSLYQNVIVYPISKFKFCEPCKHTY